MGVVLFVLPLLFPIDEITAHDIEYRNSPELGGTIVVSFHDDDVDPDTAKKAFRITPWIEGTLEWIDEANELHFLPYEPFDSEEVYTAYIDLPYSLPASIVSQRKQLVHQESQDFGPINAMVISDPSASGIPQKTGKFVDINLYTMTASLYLDGKLVDEFMVAGKGDPKPGGAHTREGNYRILKKEPNHLSGLSGVWMPFAQQYSGGYYLHEWPYWPNGNNIESKYSAGCVRFFKGDAEQIYNFTEVGTRIQIHTTPVVNNVPTASLKDNNLVREEKSRRTYIVKEVESGKYRRRVTEKIEEFYGYYEPFDGVTKVVPLGGLLEYMNINILRQKKTPRDDRELLFLIVGNLVKQKVPCNSETECRELFTRTGWDYDAVFVADSKELKTYIIGPPITEDYLRSISPEFNYLTPDPDSPVVGILFTR